MLPIPHPLKLTTLTSQHDISYLNCLFFFWAYIALVDDLICHQNIIKDLYGTKSFETQDSRCTALYTCICIQTLKNHFLHFHLGTGT